MKEGGSPIRKAGYQIQAPLCHGLGPGWAAQPLVFLDRYVAKHGFTFKPNMTIMAQSHPVYDGERFYERKGIFVGETFVITEGEPRCLNKYPVKLEVI